MTASLEPGQRTAPRILAAYIGDPITGPHRGVLDIGWAYVTQ